MTLTVAVRVLAVSALALGAFAQQQGGQFTLGGTVTNSHTGEPVKRALVTVVRHDARDAAARGSDGRFTPPPPPLTLTTFSDSAGAFWFNGLAAGDYSVSAQKPGFQTEGPDEADILTEEVKLTSSVTDLRMRLEPLGVITGKVVDQDGMPLRGVDIIVSSSTTMDGLRQTNNGQNVSTDDRGVYRLWDLSPGKYYVKAAGRSGGAHLYTGDTPPRYQSEEAFAPSYFGGGKALESATPVRIEAGTEARADFTLKMEPACKIRGAVTNFVPRRAVKFELLSGDEDVSASRVSLNGDTGVFEIQDVLPGAYTLRATQEKTRAEIPVTVGSKDLNGINLPLASGVDLTVRTSFANQGEGGACTVSLRPPGWRGGDVYTARPRRNSSGGPTLAGVLPGVYRVLIKCSGAYVRSAMSGSQDLLANPFLTVQPGVEPPALEILAAGGGGRVTGALSGIAKLADALILLVPQFVQSTGPVTAQASAGQGRPASLSSSSRTWPPAPIWPTHSRTSRNWNTATLNSSGRSVAE